MKAKVLMLAAAMLLFAATSFGQGFVTFVFETDQPLVLGCDGGAPIPDGTMYYLHQDLDSDGPDLDDPLATLCDDAPNCTVGPSGSLNWNALPFNGVAMGLGEGLFYPEYGFASLGSLPLVNRFFIRVNTATGVWMSNIFSPVAGYSEIELLTWTCVTVGPSCTQTALVALVPTADFGPQTTEPVCATLCSDAAVTGIHVGPLASPSRMPIVNITAGCAGCEGVAGSWTITDWVWMDGYYHADLELATGAVEGCVTVDLDFILAAEMGNVTVTPMDNSVKVAWNTLAETDVNRFEVVRDGATLAAVEATNNPAGSSYEYVDSDAQNGHTYKYELVVVNADQSREVVHTESVTPSHDLAVITEYALGQNFPNPFNPTTNISFDLVDNNPVTLTVYNAAGQMVATVLSNRSMEKGRHTISFDATNLTSGLYFYTVKIGNEFTATKKMLLVK